MYLLKLNGFRIVIFCYTCVFRNFSQSDQKRCWDCTYKVDTGYYLPESSSPTLFGPESEMSKGHKQTLYDPYLVAGSLNCIIDNQTYMLTWIVSYVGLLFQSGLDFINENTSTSFLFISSTFFSLTKLSNQLSC